MNHPLRGNFHSDLCLTLHSAGDLVMCLVDFNGYVGRHIDGFGEVHGGYGVSQRNFDMSNEVSGAQVIYGIMAFTAHDIEQNVLWKILPYYFTEHQMALGDFDR